MKKALMVLSLVLSATTAHASSQLESASFDYVAATQASPPISENQAEAAVAVMVVLGLCLFTSACESDGGISLQTGDSGFDEYGQLHCYFRDWQSVPECADSDTAQEARRKD